MRQSIPDRRFSAHQVPVTVITMDQNETLNHIYYRGQQATITLQMPDRVVRLEPAMIYSVVKDVLWVLLSPSLIPLDIEMDQGTSLEVRVGYGGQGFCCEATIESYSSSGILELNISSPIASNELRDYYRLDTFIPLAFHTHIAESPPPPPKVDLAIDPVKRVESRIWWDKETEQHYQWDVEENQSAIINISGGGVKARTAEPVEPGDILHVAFQIPHPELKEVSALAKVAYLHPSPTDNVNYVGMRFITLHERDRDSIIKYVFSEELRKVKTPPIAPAPAY